MPEFLQFHDLVLWLLLLGNTGQHAKCKVTWHRFFTVSLFSSVLGSHNTEETPWVWIVLPHVWKHVVSVRVAIAVIKHPNQNATLEERGLFQLTLSGSSPLLREVRTQNWRQEPIPRPWRRTAYWLPPYGSFSLFSYSIQDWQLRGSSVYSEWANVLQHCLQLCLSILWGIFLH